MDNESVIPQPAKEVCASCGATLKGDYCRKCGEKKIVPERDFSVAKFLNQTLWHFVHFDSKLLKSCWLLFSKPGFLTAEWIAGRRVGYMKPLQLFIVASVLFYFFLPTTTAYFTGSRDLIRGYEERKVMMNAFHYDFGKALTETAIKLPADKEALKTDVTAEAAQRSKSWLFIIIPFWGVFIYLFFQRKIPWLVPHLIFAMHGLTFYILLDLSIHAVTGILSVKIDGRYIFLSLMTAFPVYQALAARRVYDDTWLLTILKTTGTAAGFAVLLLLYRQMVTISTIAFI